MALRIERRKKSDLVKRALDEWAEMYRRVGGRAEYLAGRGRVVHGILFESLGPTRRVLLTQHGMAAKAHEKAMATGLSAHNYYRSLRDAETRFLQMLENEIGAAATSR